MQAYRPAPDRRLSPTPMTRRRVGRQLLRPPYEQSVAPRSCVPLLSPRVSTGSAPRSGRSLAFVPIDAKKANPTQHRVKFAPIAMISVADRARSTPVAIVLILTT